MCAAEPLERYDMALGEWHVCRQSTPRFSFHAPWKYRTCLVIWSVNEGAFFYLSYSYSLFCSEFFSRLDWQVNESKEPGRSNNQSASMWVCYRTEKMEWDVVFFYCFIEVDKDISKTSENFQPRVLLSCVQPPAQLEISYREDVLELQELWRRLWKHKCGPCLHEWVCSMLIFLLHVAGFRVAIVLLASFSR